MSHFRQVEVIGEHTLPFLGSRTYLHGTTLFEALRGHVPKAGAMTFKIARKIESNRVRVYCVSDLSEQKDDYAATLICRSADSVKSIAVQTLELHEPVERQIYNESLIGDMVALGLGEVVYEGASPFTFVATLIPMFKVLLNREHPIHAQGQWLFTRMDLDSHPQTWERIGLKLDTVLGNVLARGVIVCDGIRCGHLYYSWVV